MAEPTVSPGGDYETMLAQLKGGAGLNAAQNSAFSIQGVGGGGGDKNLFQEVMGAIGKGVMDDIKSIPHIVPALMRGWDDTQATEEENRMRRRAVANAAMLLVGAGAGGLAVKLATKTPAALAILRSSFAVGAGVNAAQSVAFETINEPAETRDVGSAFLGGALLGGAFGAIGGRIAKGFGKGKLAEGPVVKGAAGAAGGAVKPPAPPLGGIDEAAQNLAKEWPEYQAWATKGPAPREVATPTPDEMATYLREFGPKATGQPLGPWASELPKAMPGGMEERLKHLEWSALDPAVVRKAQQIVDEDLFNAFIGVNTEAGERVLKEAGEELSSAVDSKGLVTGATKNRKDLVREFALWREQALGGRAPKIPRSEEIDFNKKVLGVGSAKDATDDQLRAALASRVTTPENKVRMAGVVTPPPSGLRVPRKGGGAFDYPDQDHMDVLNLGRGRVRGLTQEGVQASKDRIGITDEQIPIYVHWVNQMGAKNPRAILEVPTWKEVQAIIPQQLVVDRKAALASLTAPAKVARPVPTKGRANQRRNQKKVEEQNAPAGAAPVAPAGGAPSGGPRTILISGDRNLTDETAIREALQSLPAGSTIIHGAARGADTIADRIAKELGLKVIARPANWKGLGKAAGPVRNEEMLGLNPDEVWAFHPDISASKGTAHMIGIAKAKGTPVKLNNRPYGITPAGGAPRAKSATEEIWGALTPDEQAGSTARANRWYIDMESKIDEMQTALDNAKKTGQPAMRERLKNSIKSAKEKYNKQAAADGVEGWGQRPVKTRETVKELPGFTLGPNWRKGERQFLLPVEGEPGKLYTKTPKNLMNKIGGQLFTFWEKAKGGTPTLSRIFFQPTKWAKSKVLTDEGVVGREVHQALWHLYHLPEGYRRVQANLKDDFVMKAMEWAVRNDLVAAEPGKAGVFIMKPNAGFLANPKPLRAGQVSERPSGVLKRMGGAKVRQAVQPEDVAAPPTPTTREGMPAAPEPEGITAASPGYVGRNVPETAIKRFELIRDTFAKQVREELKTQGVPPEQMKMLVNEQIDANLTKMHEIADDEVVFRKWFDEANPTVHPEKGKGPRGAKLDRPPDVAAAPERVAPTRARSKVPDEFEELNLKAAVVDEEGRLFIAKDLSHSKDWANAGPTKKGWFDERRNKFISVSMLERYQGSPRKALQAGAGMDRSRFTNAPREAKKAPAKSKTAQAAKRIVKGPAQERQ